MPEWHTAELVGGGGRRRFENSSIRLLSIDFLVSGTKERLESKTVLALGEGTVDKVGKEGMYTK